MLKFIFLFAGTQPVKNVGFETGPQIFDKRFRQESCRAKGNPLFEYVIDQRQLAGQFYVGHDGEWAGICSLPLIVQKVGKEVFELPEDQIASSE